jgi:hypothetical protein
MSVYFATCEALGAGFFRSAKSFDDILNKCHVAKNLFAELEENKGEVREQLIDAGGNYFGAPYDDSPYIIDSLLFSYRERGEYKYLKFVIRRIDSEGNLINLI